MTSESKREKRYNLPGYEGEVTEAQLMQLSRKKQIEVMRTWFFENYEDPVESTPYESAEGGYIYIWGGPYDALEELQEEFGDIVDEKAIEKLASELSDICDEWTKHPEYEPFDTEGYYLDEVLSFTEQKEAFESNISQTKALLTVEIPEDNKQFVLRLLYASVITCLETYLSDFFIAAITEDKALLRRFIETNPDFAKEKFTLSEVFKKSEEIERRALIYLRELIWHHLEKAKPMFAATLGVNFPECEEVFKAIVVRHDIVHRSGKSKEGEEHILTDEMVSTLIAQVEAFVADIERQWQERLERKEEAKSRSKTGKVALRT